MKTTRDQLKSLVKELLLEVLQEGIGPAVSQARPTSEGLRTQAPARRRVSFDPRLDTPLAGGRQVTDALKDAVKRESGGSSVMAGILTDTARTTLAEQLSHGDSMGRSAGGQAISRQSAPVQQEQFVGDPIDVFGDAASHWADLAFTSNKKAA